MGTIGHLFLPLFCPFHGEEAEKCVKIFSKTKHKPRKVHSEGEDFQCWVGTGAISQAEQLSLFIISTFVSSFSVFQCLIERIGTAEKKFVLCCRTLCRVSQRHLRKCKNRECTSSRDYTLAIFSFSIHGLIAVWLNTLSEIHLLPYNEVNDRKHTVVHRGFLTFCKITFAFTILLLLFFFFFLSLRFSSNMRGIPSAPCSLVLCVVRQGSGHSGKSSCVVCFLLCCPLGMWETTLTPLRFSQLPAL